VAWTKKPPLGQALSGGHEWGYKVRGTAPIIDLGRRGKLIAALRYDFPGSGSPTGTRPGDARPLDADLWPLAAFKKKRHELHAGLDQAELKNGLPQFVWVPPDANPEQAKPLLPDEFQKVLGRSFELGSISIQPIDAAVENCFQDAPTWLKRLRNRHEPNAKPFYTHPNRFDFDLGQVEKQFPPVFNDVKR